MASPTIAIIAGAATTAEHYASLSKDIESKGYPTVCKSPPSITAEDATQVTVDVDIAFVREEVLGPLLADGKDIILLCHSYGGTYGAGAVQGLSKKERAGRGEKGGVVGIIYIASFCTNPGESALDALGLGELPDWVAPGEKPGTIVFTDPSLGWSDLPAEEAKFWGDKMKPCAIAAVGTPVSYAPYQDPHYEGAIAYVWAEKDDIITAELRDLSLKKSGIKLTKNICTAHGIDQDSSYEVLKVVLELAEKFKG